MTIKRRTLTKTAVWAIPTMMAASAAPAFAVSKEDPECENLTFIEPWGYTIDSEKYLCRGFDARDNNFVDDFEKTDSMYIPFTIRAKRASGPIPAGTRFLFTVSFSAEAYSGQRDNVKNISLSQNDAYTVVGDNGFANRTTTLAIDTARDIAPGQSFVVWVRVLSGNKINESEEEVIIAGQLEEPGNRFWEGSAGENCRVKYEAAFDDDRAKKTERFSDESDRDSERNRDCEDFDSHVWIATRTVTAA